MVFLSLELMLVFVILKLDQRTKIQQLSWAQVIGLPSGVAGFFLVVYLIIHFLSVGANESERVASANPVELLKEVDVENIEGYHQARMFRDLLLLFAFGLLTAYGLIIRMTPCQHCHTPFALLSTGVTVCYCVRILLLLYHMFHYFKRYNIMASEISTYQHYNDERRLIDGAMADLSRVEEWPYCNVVDLSVFVANLMLALMATVWIENNDCALRCARLFDYSKFLLVGLYVTEGLFMFSVLVIQYYHRVSGVELATSACARLGQQRSSTQMLFKTKNR